MGDRRDAREVNCGALKDARGVHTGWVEIHSFEFVEEAIEEGRSVE